MPLIPPNIIERIRLGNDIVDVVGRYFALQKAGSRFKALCPFHKEKTPSFVVNPDRQTYHCFGCHAGGDVFRFVMEYEKVDFMTAARMLAERAGIKIEQTRDAGQDSGPDKNLLFDIHAKAARFYQELLLKSPLAEQARAYLQQRKLTGEAITTFSIGFAPDRWDALLSRFRGRFDVKDLEAAGLIIPGKQGEDGNAADCSYYDRFRNRIMFAIHDEQGRIVGFSGRALADAPGSAKYVNSPETALFHKNRILYALNRARPAIAESREALVCEGQIDVIRCHLNGITTAVAAQGTAFTEEHARILKRYADSVLLCFDGDAAGKKAAIRAADVFLQAGLSVRIVCLPPGEDPDSIILTRGAETFRAILASARNMIDFQADFLAETLNLATDTGLMRVSAELVQTIARAPNAVQQEALLRQAADRLKVPEDSLRKELNKALRKPGGPEHKAPRDPNEPNPPRWPAREMALAGALLTDPTRAALVKAFLPPEHISDPLCRQLIQIAVTAAENGDDIMAAISRSDNENRDLSRLAAEALAGPSLRGSGRADPMLSDEEAVKILILGIHADAIDRRRKAIRSRLRAGSVGGAKIAEDEEALLNAEYIHLTYDLAKLKNWNSALPLLQNP